MPTLENYLESNATRFEDELCDFVRIASVSADPNRKGEMVRAAQWVAGQLRSLNFTVEIIPTSGNPLVFAQSPHVPDAPTVLVYGHYDVQPAEPLEKWTTPPFEPAKRDGKLFARGATDDKGQVLSHIKSAEAVIKTQGKLPLNMKFLVEGEEEVGSVGLGEFLKSNAEKLGSDCIVISDGSQFAPGIPAINYGLRGIAYYEIHLQGPNRDLHSGSFGGSITNPANALAKILAGLIDEKGRVTIPGFYDDVVPLTDRERRQFAELPFVEQEYFRNVGVEGAVGEEGYTALERRWARPTFDICGLWSGYQGEGAKTVLPATAGAKISFRLVPNQTPEKIAAGLKRKLAELTPPGIQLEFIAHHGGPGVLVSLESPYIEAAARAIEFAFSRRPVFTREGGSIPIVAKFAEHLKVDILLLGWGQEDDNAHSPNEKFSLDDFHKAIKASAKLWEELAKISGEWRVESGE
ncbi:MAG: dipeptidase [Pirellulales bacterium]|nr:dipeptidase [Pirellulales bacterium]